MIHHAPALSFLAAAGLVLLGCTYTLGLLALIVVALGVAAYARWEDGR